MDGAAILELLLQALEVFEEKVDRPRPGEQYPGVGYEEVCARWRGRSVLVQDFLVLALAVEIARDQLEYVRIAAGIEWRRWPVFLSC